MKTTWADISKASQLLQWQPQTTLEEGLKKCVCWHQENQPWSGNIGLQLEKDDQMVSPSVYNLQALKWGA